MENTDATHGAGPSAPRAVWQRRLASPASSDHCHRAKRRDRHVFCRKGFALDYSMLIKETVEVLAYVFRRSDSFSVVTDLTKPYSKIPPRCRQDEWTINLQPYLISQNVGAKEWPGVRNRNCHKVLSFYRACKQTEAIVQAWPNVFQACEYRLPEDICFYRDGTAWFATTSHERTADALALSMEEEAFFYPFRRRDT